MLQALTDTGFPAKQLSLKLPQLLRIHGSSLLKTKTMGKKGVPSIYTLTSEQRGGGGPKAMRATSMPMVANKGPEATTQPPTSLHALTVTAASHIFSRRALTAARSYLT